MKKAREVKLILKIWILLPLLALLLILSILFPFKGWWNVILALGLAFAFSYFSIRSLRDHLEIQREMRYGWAKVGDVLEERILVHNNSPIPTTWLEIIDHTTIPGYRNAIGTNVGPNNHTTWRTRHICSRRGLYRLGPTTVETSDLFGFFHLSIHDPTEVNILITPPIIPLPHIEVASGGRTGDGKFAKGNLEQSVAVSTIRDYQHQDPMTHIHWPISAKRGELTSRVFERTPTGNWWVVQDMYAGVQVGNKNNNTLETGIILSASVAHKGIKGGKAVGFFANDQRGSWIPAQHAGDQTMKILQSLALSEAGDLPLEGLLNNSRTFLQHAASLIIITPDITLGWWDALLWLKWKGLIPTVLLLDPKSFGGVTTPHAALRQLQNAGIPAYTIRAEMFEDQIKISEKPLWEWRVFGTGQAIPVRKPKDPDWKELS